MTRRLALVVGDTAGHVNPALAVAETYLALFAPVEVLFLAAQDGPATAMVAASGYPLEIVAGLPLARAGITGKLGALARVIPCFVTARRTLSAHRTRLVIGSGGYASGGVLLAGRSLGLRTAVIEPNVDLGLANWLLKPIAQRAYCRLPETVRHFPPGRGVVTGAPVRRDVNAASGTRAAEDRSPTPLRILVTSGSRGGTFLAERIPPLLAFLRDFHGLDFEVLHQTGVADVPQLRRAYEGLGLNARVEPHLPSLADAYTWATLAITRAGAGTLAELALNGLPALLVPLADAAADHQAHNAKQYADTGAALWTREAHWQRDTVASQIARLCLNPAAWRQMAAAARAQSRPDAAESIVRDCEAVMAGRW